MSYYYRRRSRWPYRSWRRWGVSRAQSQGTRRFSVSFPCETSIAVPTSGANSIVFGVHPFYSSPQPAGGPILPEYFRGFCNLVANNVYLTYCSLYDEVKVNSVSVTVSVLNLPVGTGVRIVSAVDRHSNLRDVLSAHQINDIRQAPECKNSVFTSLDRAKMYRYIKARDTGERTSFIDSSNGNVVVPAYTTSSGVAVPAHQIFANTDWFDNNYTLAPNIVFAVELTASPPAGSSLVIGLNCRWNVTFRNPKYGSGADAAFDGEGDEDGNSKTFSEMKAGVVEDMKEGVSGVSEGSALRKKVKFEEPVYEESVIPDDEKDDEMDDESSQPELTKEEILELLKKYEEKKS